VQNAAGTGRTPWLESIYVNQRIYVISGVLLMVAVSFIDYRLIARFYIPIYAVCIALLVIVMIIGADDASGTARWIRLPVPGRSDISIQPSEFAKIFMIIFLAKFIETKKDNFNRILMLCFILILVAVPVVLVQRQPSLSASLIIAMIAVTVLFAGGLYFRTIIIGLSVIIPACAVVYFDMNRQNPLFMTRLFPYQWVRIQTYLNPVPNSAEFYQVQSSLYSIGSGGMYGKGFGNNTYIPNGHNDFIFSVVGEQFGFVGCAVLLGVMAFIIFKCVLIAQRTADMLGKLIAAGTAGMILFEAFVHVSVVTNLLPNTGMPFPFLSYGGTAMWVHMIAVGMVLNIGIVRPKSIFAED
jgi:rod shape determining protein RodA